ncbi:hypothetical protein UFOVP106_53 [uncultured Caudovirales phage]|uniref:Uncharacterized protein n=1 Tax=uncultured Caudovirales phage TaxID=2100421 RepID=A0A6J5L0R9_9CAUD|nr:hypothetical protein UFOVP106_53 [uncultured Caudovirales phage]
MYTKEEAIERKRARDREAYKKKVNRQVGNAGRPANTPEVLWSKVDKKAENECWNWKGYKNDGGYGRTWINDYGYYAHRVIFDLVYPNTITLSAPKDTDESGFLLHTCDNPSCCNPNHLFIGTHTENMADKVAKNRQTKFPTDKGPRCKLSMAQAREIRQLRKNGISARELSQRYELSLASIKTLLRGNSYKE